jgi:23S rRNA pseudouridine955/2504/2580 synthase
MKYLGKQSATRVQVDESADGQRLDNFLLRHLKGVPKSHLYRLVRGGEVRVNSRRVDASQRLQRGDEVRIPPVRTAAPALALSPRAPLPQAQRLLPHVLYRDDALLLLNKPSGWAVHGGSGVSYGVIEQLRRELPEQRFVELAHRLDRETSGVLIIALKRAALVALHDQFRDGIPDKRYLALATGRWRDALRNVRLGLHKYLTPNGERRVSVIEGGQASHTVFRRQRTWPGFALLEAELKTGRTHQIRVHLAHLKCPIAGDDKYGNFELNKELQGLGLKRMFLHARSLALPHPITGEMLRAEAPLPQELQAFLDYLDATHATPI